MGEAGAAVVPELSEVLTVEAGGPLERVEEPPAEDVEGGLSAVDSGVLPESAGGLLVGGETLTVEMPGSDTLTSGVPDEDVSGRETLIEGVLDGDAPSSDTPTNGALGADPSGSDTLITEVCNSGTLTSGGSGEDAVEGLDGSVAWAFAHATVSSVVHRPASSAVHKPASSPATPGPTHRGRGLAVRLRFP